MEPITAAIAAILAANRSKPKLYVKTGCPGVSQVIEYLEAQGIAYEAVAVTDNPPACRKWSESPASIAMSSNLSATACWPFFGLPTLLPARSGRLAR
jgi:hypothetical protein